MFIVLVLCFKVILKEQKQEINIPAMGKRRCILHGVSVSTSVFPHLSAKVSCLLAHVVYGNIQGIAPLLSSSLKGEKMA